MDQIIIIIIIIIVIIIIIITVTKKVTQQKKQIFQSKTRQFVERLFEAHASQWPTFQQAQILDTLGHSSKQPSCRFFSHVFLYAPFDSKKSLDEKKMYEILNLVVTYQIFKDRLGKVNLEVTFSVTWNPQKLSWKKRS